MKPQRLVFLAALLLQVFFPAVRGATLIAADEESTVYTGNLYNVAALTPKGTKWTYATGYAPRELVIAGRFLLVGYLECRLASGGGGLDYCKNYPFIYALDRQTGKLIWHYNSYPTEGGDSPLQIDTSGNIHYAGVIIDSADGSVLPNIGTTYSESADGIDLNLNPAMSVVSEYSIGSDGTYYRVSGGLVTSLDHYTGMTNWTSRIIRSGTEPLVAEDGSVLVGDLSGSFYALDRLTGGKLWELPGAPNTYSSAVALSGNRVAVIRNQPAPPPENHSCQILILDARTGSFISSNTAPRDLPQDTPLLVLPNGLLFANAEIPVWFSGNFRYADSPWPVRNSKNSNIRSLARSGSPQILSQPEPASLSNNVARFSVYASGSFPLHFQWLKNGFPISDATNGFYSATNAQFTDRFVVQITNTSGSITSAETGVGYALNVSVDGGRALVEPLLPAYPPGTKVTLTAIGRTNGIFEGWHGSVESNDNPLALVVEKNLALSGSIQLDAFEIVSRDVVGEVGELPILPGGSNVVFIPFQRQILAFDIASHQERWRSGWTGNSIGQCALSPTGDLVLFDAATLYVLDSETGATKWTREISPRSLAIDPQGTIYSFGTKVVAYSPTGTRLWETAEVNCSHGFIGENGNLYSPIAYPSEIRAFDRLSGASLWTTSGQTVYPASLNRLVTYSEVSPGWRLRLIDANSGATILSRVATPNWIGSPPEVRAPGTGGIMLGGGLFTGSVQNWVEWNLSDNSLTGLPFLGHAGNILTANGIMLMVVYNQLSGYDVHTRLVSPLEPPRPLSFVAVPTSLTILANGRLAALAGPGFLNVYEAKERLAPSVASCDDLNLQGTRSVLRNGVPIIYKEPENQAYKPGIPARFEVGATGNTPLSYQWFRDGIAVEGANGPELKLDEASANLQSAFAVLITNSAGSATSGVVRLGYMVKVLTEGQGGVQPDVSNKIFLPNETVTLGAVSTNRRFLQWSGNAAGTNEILTFQVASNTVIHAQFEAFPGDRLWQIPVISEVRPGFPIHASIRWPQVLLPGFVLLNLEDRSMSPLAGSDFVLSTAQREEDVYSWENLSSGTTLVHFRFGSGVERRPTGQVDTKPVVDGQTNIYAAGPDGLFKLDAHGGILWSNRISPSFYSFSAELRIGEYGFLWRPSPWDENADFLVFDLGTGSILNRLKKVWSPSIPFFGSEFVSVVTDKNSKAVVGGVDFLSQVVRWTNSEVSFSGPIMQEGDLYAKFSGGNQVGIKTVDLVSGLTIQTIKMTNGVGDMILGVDHKVYATSLQAISCVNLSTRVVEWTATPPDYNSGFISPICLTPEGVIYCLTTDNMLLAYKASAGLADSAWPEPNGKGNSFAVTPPRLVERVNLTIERSANYYLLKFETQPNTTYTLETSQIFPPSWVEAQMIEGTGRPGSIELAKNSSRAFYRVRAAKR